MSYVIWHDLECGSYGEDLPLWRTLADRHGDPILDVGAGTGRVALALARDGHRVTALDRDPLLLAELERRAGDELALSTAVADAREFELESEFALCLVPMQTIQLLGGASGRQAFLRCAQAHLRPDGVLAAAIAEKLETYSTATGDPEPLPDMCERDGTVYFSSPTAVRADGDGFVLERRRETVSAAGARTVAENTIRLDRLTAGELEAEAQRAGLRPAGREHVPANADYVGSEVVVLRV
jgi:SAM-dependent methyltransferase